VSVTRPCRNGERRVDARAMPNIIRSVVRAEATNDGRARAGWDTNAGGYCRRVSFREKIKMRCCCRLRCGGIGPNEPPAYRLSIEIVPNCDFYATPEDHEPLLRWLFAEATCHVYELASAFEQPMKRFESEVDVMRQFERRYPNGDRWQVHLQLYVLGAGPPFEPRRIALNPSACGGATFRYTAEGWGLVQLYLSAPRSDRLENSHTNHNSRTRAERWEPIHADQAGTDAWDFARISAFSSRLNRQIRKRGVAKVGNRTVLPGALKLWESGMTLAPYVPGKHVLRMRA